MKSIKLLLLFTLSCMVLISSCSEKEMDPDNAEDSGDIPTNAEYYISYKVGGESFVLADSKALRGQKGEYQTLGLEGSSKSGAHPKFKFHYDGSIIGIDPGLNILSINTEYSSSQYLEITTKAGVLYSSKNDTEGCHLAITARDKYQKGGIIEGVFSGFVSSGDNKRLEITEGRYKVQFAD